jgi:hypothetical protein
MRGPAPGIIKADAQARVSIVMRWLEQSVRQEGSWPGSANAQ